MVAKVNILFISLSPLVLQKVITEICNGESSSFVPASNRHTARADSGDRTDGEAAYYPPEGYPRGSTYQPGPA